MEPEKTWFGHKIGTAAAIAVLSIGIAVNPAMASEKDETRAEAAPFSDGSPTPLWIANSPEVRDHMGDRPERPELLERPERPERSEPPEAPSSHSTTVRMVIDRTTDDSETSTRLCIFVPSSDGEAGVLSCDGQEDVRVLEFGPQVGRNVMFGDDVIEEEALREMIEARMEAVAERLENIGDMRIEYLDRAEEVEDLHDEMQDLREEMRDREMEMREAQREHEHARREPEHEREREPGFHTQARIHVESSDGDWEIEFTEEERAEFEEEMEEFAREMEEFGQEMAGLQAEVMIELSDSLGNLTLDFDGTFAEGMEEFGAGMAAWAEEFSRAQGNNRPVHFRDSTSVRVVSDNDGNFTLVETIVDEDGRNRVLVHTTDLDSVEVILVEKGSMEIGHDR